MFLLNLALLPKHVWLSASDFCLQQERNQTCFEFENFWDGNFALEFPNNVTGQSDRTDENMNDSYIKLRCLYFTLQAHSI